MTPWSWVIMLFLDVMTYDEMLAVFLENDQQSSQKWRLKGHAMKDSMNLLVWAMFGHLKT